MDDTEKKGWLSRLRSGLSRSSQQLGDGISGVFTKHKLDDETLDKLEETLIAADLGPQTAAKLVEDFARERFGKDVTDAEVRTALAQQIADILWPCAVPLEIDRAKKPFVVLVVGVNGTGKTTTIGKLAKHYKEQGLNVMMAAGDTFRAAAISQLQIWGERAGVPVISTTPGGDSAALAFEALQKAQSAKADLLLIDTAGRLHNKTDLMQELAKLSRVLKKLDRYRASRHASGARCHHRPKRACAGRNFPRANQHYWSDCHQTGWFSQRRCAGGIGRPFRPSHSCDWRGGRCRRPAGF